MIAALLVVLTCAQAPATQSSDADVLRGLVQQYYDAQAREDASAVMSFWATGAANPPSRNALAAAFAAGDDGFRVDIRRVEIDGSTAHVRMLVQRMHTGPDRTGAVTPQQTSTFMLETWTRDGESWKLDAEKPLADAIADALLAAAPDQWPTMLAAEDPVVVLGALRVTVGNRASTAAVSQQYAKAILPFSLLREIGRFAAAPRIEMEALQNIGNANFFLRKYPESADAYAQELALSRETHDEEYEATALDGGAMVAYSRGDYTAALEGYRAALDIAERKKEPAVIGRALVSVGNVQYLQGDYDLAARSYRRAISLLSDAHDNRTAAMAWRGAARVYVAQGDLAAALVSATHALDDSRARSARSEIANDQESIGEIHFRLGNANEARKAFDESRQLFDADEDLNGAGRLFGDIGLTELMAERFDAAVAAYTESRKRFQDARNPPGIGHSWVGIGFSETGRGRFDDAIDAYKIAIGIFNASERKEDAGRAWLGLSLAHYAAGDYTSALDDAAHVSGIAADIHNEDLTWRADVRAGDALRRLDRLDEAAGKYDEAIGSIHKIVPLAATSADARTALEDSESAWAGLAFTRAAAGDADGALLAAEERRSHVLRVMLAPFARDITRGMTPDEVSTERAALRTITSLNAQLRAERAAAQPDRGRIDRVQHQLSAAETDRDDQQHAIYARLPDLKVWRGLRPIRAIDQLDPALEPGALAIEYVAEDDQLLVLTAIRRARDTDDGLRTTETTASIVSWKRRDFAQAVSDALDPAALSDVNEWNRRARPLSETLLTEVTSRLAGISRVVVVPDDILWKVPFEALPLGPSDLRSTADVTYSSSLYTLALRRAPRDGDGAAFVAAPTLPADTALQLAAADPRWTPQDAVAVGKGVSEQAGAYGARAQVVSGGEATQEAAAAAVEHESVIEISARTQLSGAAPLFSAALLAASSRDGADDGRWEVREWFNLRARGASLVLADGNGVATPGLSAAIAALDWASAAAGISAVVLAWTPSAAFDVQPLLCDIHKAHTTGAQLGTAYGEATSGARQTAPAPSAWAGLRLLGRIQ